MYSEFVTSHFDPMCYDVIFRINMKPKSFNNQKANAVKQLPTKVSGNLLKHTVINHTQ